MTHSVDIRSFSVGTMRATAAIVLSLVTSAAVYFLCGELITWAIWFFSGTWGALSPWSIVFTSIVSILAAKWSCDHAIKRYSTKSVGLFYIIICLITLVGTVVMWDEIEVYRVEGVVQPLAWAFASYVIFWRETV